ncbi:MAG: GntR family transcriptional regulator [Candidatus Cloacimonetes bacterium]|nr:GntR family transcriptional regulator [Candidatus Cloacimonadota bacterium]
MKIFNDEAPIYLQLRKHIEELILDRALSEEAAIPSIRIMARDYELNPITVGNALSSLVDEGVLYKKRGVGIFVSRGARELIISERGKDFITDSLKPVLKKARQLELAREEVIELTNSIYGGKDE